MANEILAQMAQLQRKPEQLESSIGYLATSLHFLKKNETVLICFAKDKTGCLGDLMEEAVRRAGATPVMVGSDWRWKSLLRLAFSTRATTIIAPPLVVLGIAKLAKYKGTPLSIRTVITAAYPCLDWMIDGIMRYLDCKTWGCFDPGSNALIAGFSCGSSRGVHLRDDQYGIEIVDSNGKALPDGEFGDMVLYLLDKPELRYNMREQARVDRTPCTCGCKSLRLMDMQPAYPQNHELDNLRQQLIAWSSILDCRLKKTEFGLEMELVVFPGEKLPKLPSAAKQVLRPWDPEKDEPFYYVPGC